MTEAHRLSIAEVRRETSEAVTIVFDDPTGAIGGRSGQHVVVHVEVDGETHRRVYSLSSSPELSQAPSITVKETTGGMISPRLVAARVGEELGVEPAAGVFGVDIDPANARTYFAFIAGSGSVPVMSIIRTILALEPASTAHIAYGNRSEESVIFDGELQQLSAEHPDRISITHVFSSQGSRIDHRFVNDWLMDHPPTSWDLRYLVCGPPGMNETVAARLASLGVPDEHVLVEHYLPPRRTDAPAPFDGAVVAVSGSGESVVAAGATILTAIARDGAPVEWACQSGVCGTCKAQLVNGEVDPGFPFVLSDDEQAAGLILTCISRPLSQRVAIRLVD